MCVWSESAIANCRLNCARSRTRYADSRTSCLASSSPQCTGVPCKAACYLSLLSNNSIWGSIKPKALPVLLHRPRPFLLILSSPRPRPRPLCHYLMLLFCASDGDCGREMRQPATATATTTVAVKDVLSCSKSSSPAPLVSCGSAPPRPLLPRYPVSNSSSQYFN